MKRLATGTFILFYAAFAVLLTVDRTFTWAAAHAESSKPRAAELLAPLATSVPDRDVRRGVCHLSKPGHFHSVDR